MIIRRPSLQKISFAAVLFAIAFLIHIPHTIFDVAAVNWDFETHYGWTVQFIDAFYAGNPYPRWMPQGNLGLGEPSLLYYAPLFYYIASAFKIVLPSSWAAIKAVEVFATGLVGFFSWALLRPYTSRQTAWIGAICCMAAPMTYMLFHYFNGFPWGASSAAFTALLYFAVRPQSPTKLVSLPISIALAALVLTHTVSGLMALICLSAAQLIVSIRKDAGVWRITTRPLLSWFVSCALGLILTMPYLYPALTLTHLISPEVWSTLYTPFNAFAFPTVTYWLFGMRWFSFQWVVPGVTLLCLIWATAFAYSNWRTMDADSRRVLGLLLVTAWVSVFLASEFSYLLWAFESPLRKVQFPHRFFYIATPISILVCAIALSYCISWHRRVSALLGISCMALPTLLSAALAANIILREGRPLRLDLDAVAPYSSHQEYQLDTQPADWQQYMKSGGLQGECAKLSLRCVSLGTKGVPYAWRIEANANAVLRLPVLAFPAWRVQFNGANMQWSVDENSGLVSVALPAGTHQISVKWHRLVEEKIGAALGGLGGIVMLVLFRMRGHGA